MAIVLSTYLVIGLALPVLPLYVHDSLGLGTVAVGLVAGSQFLAALLSRLPAGRLADRRGGKQAVVIGLLFATVAGLLYVLSVRVTGEPIMAMVVLLLGRGLLGAAESFVIAGAMSWGLVLVRQQDAGKVIAWVGTAIYVGYALGAPAGTALYGGHGFGAIALATTVLPVMTLALVARLHAVRPQPSIQPPLTSVLGVVLLPGLGLALTSIGYGAMTTFIALLFAHRGWGQAWLALTVFSGAVIGGRLVLGHLPDRFGLCAG